MWPRSGCHCERSAAIQHIQKPGAADKPLDRHTALAMTEGSGSPRYARDDTYTDTQCSNNLPHRCVGQISFADKQDLS